MRTALEHEDSEVIRNSKEGLDVCLRLLGDRDECLGAMAHLHHADAHALVVDTVGGGLL